MAADITKINPELEALFRKYESAPDSFVFAPLADAYRKAGMHDEAVEICRKGVRRHPDYPSGHVVQGKCYFDIGDLDLAEEAFKNVLKLDASNLVALKFLGMIQAGRGDLNRADEYFQHILVLDPENREIMGMLEDIREVDKSLARPSNVQKDESGDTTDDRPAARDESPVDDEGGDDGWKDDTDEDSFEGSPIQLGEEDGMSDDLATTTLADIYAAQGYYDKAGRIYREVLRRQPDNTEIRNKLEALESGGDAGEPAEKAPAAPASKPADKKSGAVEPEPEFETKDETLQAESSVEDHSAIDLDDPAPSPQPASPPAARRAATRKPEREVPADASAGSKLDDKKSYGQFKRWLENMQK